MRRLKIFAALMLGVLALGLAAAAPGDPYSGDGGVSDFYRWDGPIPGKPGTMLRQEAMTPDAAMAGVSGQSRRILYTSTGIAAGDPAIIVSGALYLPKGRPPSSGWPLVAWAHGTTGVADVCAPSWMGQGARNAAYLAAWLSHGFAVVATDYQGLGTPGLHPYLHYRAEAKGVLDSARAVLAAYPRSLANKVILVGQSQGSGAALGAAYLAPTYAPDVNVLATVATGLVIGVQDIGGARQLTVPPWTNPDAVQAAFQTLYFLGLDRGFDPSLSPGDYVAAAAMPVVEAGMHGCLRDMMEVARVRGLSMATTFTRDIAPLQKREPAYQNLPDAKFKTPIFTGTGLADRLAGLEPQYNFISAACKAGSNVTWRYYAGATHSGAVNRSLTDSMPFVLDLLKGHVPASNCAALQEPGTLQAPDPSLPMND